MKYVLRYFLNNVVIVWHFWCILLPTRTEVDEWRCPPLLFPKGVDFQGKLFLTTKSFIKPFFRDVSWGQATLAWKKKTRDTSDDSRFFIRNKRRLVLLHSVFKKVELSASDLKKILTSICFKVFLIVQISISCKISNQLYFSP